FSSPFLSRLPRLSRSTLFPYTTLLRSSIMSVNARSYNNYKTIHYSYVCNDCHANDRPFMSVSESILENAFYDYMRRFPILELNKDRKSTRLNSSHVSISYAVFCLKKKS